MVSEKNFKKIFPAHEKARFLAPWIKQEKTAYILHYIAPPFWGRNCTSPPRREFWRKFASKGRSNPLERRKKLDKKTSSCYNTGCCLLSGYSGQAESSQKGCWSKAFFRLSENVLSVFVRRRRTFFFKSTLLFGRKKRRTFLFPARLVGGAKKNLLVRWFDEKNTWLVFFSCNYACCCSSRILGSRRFIQKQQIPGLFLSDAGNRF